MRIVFLDINYTATLFDGIGNVGFAGAINCIIADQAWGRVSQDGSWTLAFDELLDFEDDPVRSKPDPDTVSYSDYCRYVKHKPRPEDSDAERRARKLKSYADCVAFTRDGQPGAQFRHVADEMLAQLSAVSSGSGDGDRDDDEKDGLQLLPAVREMLRFLERSDEDYRVVVRTFGSDGELFARAWNALVEEEGLPSSVAIDMNTDTFATLRCDDGDYLVADRAFIGGDEMKPDRGLSQFSAEARAAAVKGLQAMNEALMSAARERGTLLVRDCYLWWHAHGRKTGGKWMLLPDDPQTSTVFFFDDSVKRNSVEVWSSDGRTTEGSRDDKFWFWFTYVWPVSPRKVVSNPDFFVKAIVEMEKKQRTKKRCNKTTM